MPDLKLAPVLELTQLASMRPVLEAWAGDGLDRVVVDSTRLEAPERFWITYAHGERRLTLKVYFRGEHYADQRSRMERSYPEHLNRFDHPDGGLAFLPELNGIVWTFPFDPAMPKLGRCFDGAWISGLLMGPLQRTSYEPLHVSIASYTPEVGAVLVYRDAAGKAVAYGKCAPEDTSGLIYAAMQQLWDASARQAGHLLLARPLAYWPEASLLLQAPVAGAPLPSHRNRRIFLTMAQRAGTALAAIHGSGITLGPVRLLAEPAERLRNALDDVAHTAPALYPDFRALVRWLEAYPSPSEQTILVPSHGDFKWDQFLEQRGRFSLIDFEFFCQAEPDLDLGNFCAYLYPSQSEDWRDGAVAEMLRASFLEHYRRAGGAPIDPRRLACYEAAALGLRVLSFVWQHQGGWPWQASQLLELALDRLLDPKIDAALASPT